MIVIKFGGTSVSSIAHSTGLLDIIKSQPQDCVIVVSALSGVTTLLDQIAAQSLNEVPQTAIEQFKETHFTLVKAVFTDSLQGALLLEIQKKVNFLEQVATSVHTLHELSDRTRAMIMGLGEQLSSFILAHYLKAHDSEATLLNSKDLIRTDSAYLNGTVDFDKTAQLINDTVKTGRYITGGFIAGNDRGEIVTLGRGGSDYTASIYGYALNATRVEIWSDVDGVHSADPRKVKNTVTLNTLSYEEAFEMAYFGAKVLYPPSVLPLRTKQIPLHLKNTNEPAAQGTVIHNHTGVDEHKIQGVSTLNNIALITVSGVGLSGKKGSARRVFQALEENNVNVILITQSCSEQSIGLGLLESDAPAAAAALENAFSKEIELGLLNGIQVATGFCIVALIGDKMKSRAGLCGQVFGAIGENGINITAIAQGASERNISIVIDKKDEKKALNVIHERFFSKQIKHVHLFIAGIGNVGMEFLQIIHDQQQLLHTNYEISLKIIGVANSRTMLFSEDGLSLDQIKDIKNTGVAYTDLQTVCDSFIQLNLANSVFIDNTASAIVSKHYVPFLKNSISVVTCNKIACSSTSDIYKELKDAARDHNCQFKYETSVGAALPVIKTIQDLLVSGDQIKKIEAVISGSLNFIFNKYNATAPFATVVREAMDLGFTEPDPLIDLSGLDVMRKLLILSRESGYKKEMTDIVYKSFLPAVCENAASNDILFEELTNNEAYFKEMYNSAVANACRLKVVALLEDGNLQVALKQIPSDSPFYNLQGKDNVIALNTTRYVDEPLVIKGAGAGAVVTASGVFGDLMLIVNK